MMHAQSSHFGLLSFAPRHSFERALFYFWTRGWTRSGGLLDPTSRRDRSINAFLRQIRAKNDAPICWIAREKKRIFLPRTTSERALFRGPFHETCDSFKIALIPSPAAFHLIASSTLFVKVITLTPHVKQGKLDEAK